jgi:hypothetical protein
LILKTTDAGAGWSQQTSGTGTLLWSIYFNSTLTGWATGNSGFIIKSTNGGSNWTQQTSGTGNFLHWVFFPASNTGWAIGGNGTIVATTNGGSNWVSQASNVTPNLRSSYFVSTTTGWIVGENGTIIKTTDGGGFFTGITTIGASAPETYKLYQNYPNPFNSSSKIKMQISKLGNVKLTVYDILGREIAALVNEQLAAGTYEVQWESTDHPSGVYFYKLTAGDFSQTKKMVLLK